MSDALCSSSTDAAAMSMVRNSPPNSLPVSIDSIGRICLPFALRNSTTMCCISALSLCNDSAIIAFNCSSSQDRSARICSNSVIIIFCNAKVAINLLCFETFMRNISKYRQKGVILNVFSEFMNTLAVIILIFPAKNSSPIWKKKNWFYSTPTHSYSVPIMHSYATHDTHRRG